MIIARVHLAQEKEKILRLGRQSSMEYEGNRILIFLDYTAEVMEQQRSFREVLQLLRDRDIRHSLRFPARLHINYQRQVKTFDHPDEAKIFVNQKLWKLTFLNIDKESLNVFWADFYLSNFFCFQC